MTGAACIFIAIAVAYVAILYADLRKTVDRLEAESWKRKYDEKLDEMNFLEIKIADAEQKYHNLLRDLANAEAFADAKPIKPFTGRKKR